MNTKCIPQAGETAWLALFELATSAGKFVAYRESRHRKPKS
jgi:hypothetical protein